MSMILLFYATNYIHCDILACDMMIIPFIVAYSSLIMLKIYHLTFCIAYLHYIAIMWIVIKLMYCLTSLSTTKMYFSFPCHIQNDPGYLELTQVMLHA